MQDSAAEILHVRRNLGGGFAAAIVSSTAFHIAGVILLLLIAQRSGTVRAPVLTIRLAPAGMARAAAGAIAAPALRQQTKSVAPAKQLPSRRETPVLPPKPAATPQPKKQVDSSVFGRSNKKETAALPAKSATPLAGSTGSGIAAASSNIPAVGSAGVSALEGGEFPYSMYIDRMLTLIGAHWFRPQAPGEAITRVVFVIQRDGTLRDARIESESGSGTFDRAALRAVIESSPLPPLPFGYTGNSLGVHLTFH